MSQGLRKPRLACSHVCRGEGKVYSLVTLSGEVPGCKLSAFSRTAAGYEVPVSLILRKGRGDWVLAVPILSVAQVCTIAAVGCDGRVVAQRDFVFKPALSRLKSVANTLRNDSIAQAIRNYDAWPNGSATSFELLRVLPMQDGSVVLHVCISVTALSRDDLNGGFDTRFLRSDGSVFDVDCLIAMQDTVTSSFEYDGLWVRKIVYSMRMKMPVSSFFVWVASFKAGGLEGFFEINAIDVERKLDYRRCATCDASLDNEEYEEWFRREHAAKDFELSIQEQYEFSQRPLFSIVMPLHRSSVDSLIRSVECVLRQSYGHFQLVLVNASPDALELTAAALEYALEDSRVTYTEQKMSLHVSESCDVGITVSRGDYVCFLIPGDELTPDALFCCARTINENLAVDLLYSDEDVTDGTRLFSPFFKPDWSPDLLESMNYVSRFMCVRKAVVDGLGSRINAFDCSYDYHLALCVTESTDNVWHIPRVLYHRFVHETSASDGFDNANDLLGADMRALEARMQRKGAFAKVQPNPRLPFGSGFEVTYKLTSSPLVSVIIPNKDNTDMLSRCIESIIERTTYSNYEIIIVENNSEESGTFEYYDRIQAQYERVRIVRYCGAFNYSLVNNYGVGSASGDYLLFLNNDTEIVTEDWMERMLALCARDSTGAVGVKLVYPDRSVQHGGVIGLDGGPYHLFTYVDADAAGYYGLLQRRRNLSAVTAACMMVKRSAFDEAGGFNEEFVVDYNDVALCLAIQDAGHLVVYEPAVEVVHFESVSRGGHDTDESKIRWAHEKALLFEKWPQFSALPDPFGSPNCRRYQNEHYLGIWRG